MHKFVMKDSGFNLKTRLLIIHVVWHGINWALYVWYGLISVCAQCVTKQWLPPLCIFLLLTQNSRIAAENLSVWARRGKITPNRWPYCFIYIHLDTCTLTEMWFYRHNDTGLHLWIQYDCTHAQISLSML